MQLQELASQGFQCLMIGFRSFKLPSHGTSIQTSDALSPGVTADFGLHDGQQSVGGGAHSTSSVPDVLRGGNSHTQMAARVGGQKGGDNSFFLQISMFIVHNVITQLTCKIHGETDGTVPL